MKLTIIQEKILDALRKSKLTEKFYWTGGTLLAYYYLHHRLSFDLDFFSESPFQYEELIPFLESVKTELKIDRLDETRIHDRWDFVIPGVKNGGRFEFVHYNHSKKRLAPLVSFKGVMIDSLPDLAANKVMAYFDRNQPKDLFDVYTLIIQKKFTVKQLLKNVEKKFGSNFNEFSFWSESAKGLKQLTSLKPYFLQKDEEIPRLIAEIKSFFLEGGRNYLDSRISAS